MYTGFNPRLLEEARATAQRCRKPVDVILPDIIRKWKAFNMPTLVGDFRPTSVQDTYDHLNRVKA